MRAIVVPLDPNAAQDELLRSYCGASRFAYNWTVGIAKENRDLRANERRAGVKESDLTKPLDWSSWTMTPLWNSVMRDVAPWHCDVTKHAFRCGVTNASNALMNYAESKRGERRGRPIEFPKFKNRHSKLSFTLIEFKNTDYWFSDDSRHVRLVLPKSASDPRITRRREQLRWMHTTESLKSFKNKVKSGEWTIQAVTISFAGGRWQASFAVRKYIRAEQSIRVAGPIIGIDFGIKYLATLSLPVKGLSDEDGHVANPRILESERKRLSKIDRQLSRCKKGSKNHSQLRLRRQRQYGRVWRTRQLHLHRLSTALVGSFETIVLEDLDVMGMLKDSSKALRRSILDAGLAELRRQVSYKMEDSGRRVVVVDRYFPSSKMCSHCGVTKAKLALSDRIFVCSACGISLDRDVNAARNIRDEGIRLLTNESMIVAGHQPETLNAVSRGRKTGTPRWDGRDHYQNRTTHPTWEFLTSA